MVRFDPVRLIAPTTTLLTVEVLRAHCRVQRTDQDDQLLAYATAAEGYLDRVLRRCMLDQTWSNGFSSFPATGLITLEPGRVSAVTRIAYADLDGVEQEMDPALVELVHQRGASLICLKPGEAWPQTSESVLKAVTIEYVAGYGPDPANVPQEIVQAAKLLAGHYYENRESSVIGNVSVHDLPHSVKMLLSPHFHWSV